MKSDARSTPELIQAVLTAVNDTQKFEIIGVLQFRGDRDVFEAAKSLCFSLKPSEREVSACILGQLGIPERTFPEESVEILLDLLAREQHPEVLCSVGIALGHLQAQKAVPALVALKNHPHADVRYGVVMGLLCQTDEQAIQALIELSTDQDWDVRNWATFGLGSMVEVDTPTLRQALWERLRHEPAREGDEIYGEALVGLAERKDEQLIEPLLQELGAKHVGRWAVEAASILADSRLYDTLLELKQECHDSQSSLEEAIEACAPVSSGLAGS